MRKILSILVLSITLFPLSGYSWGPTGHRVVAEIAQRHLSSSALKAVKKILSGNDLADVANWADEIRSNPQYGAFSPLHFADVGSNYKSYEEAPKPAGGDVVMAIMALTDYLKTGSASALAKVPALARVDQVQALKLLVHFVGDVHQPLHVGDPADKGGNAVAVNWMNKWPSNLHSIWDDEMLDMEKMSYNDFAGFLDRTYRSQESTWTSGNAVTWADESLSYRAEIYVFPDRQTPGAPTFIYYDYLDKAKPIFRQRLYQGGIRLAMILNSLFSH